MIKINVLGSCVSRVSLLDGVQSAHGVSDDRLDLGYFLDKQNIVCAMLPVPFSRCGWNKFYHTIPDPLLRGLPE